MNIYKVLSKTLLLIIFFFSGVNLSASSASDKYFYAKKNYTTAVISSNRKKEIKYLRSIITYGTILSKDVSKYQKLLNKLEKKTTSSYRKNSKNSKKTTKISKKTTKSSKKTTKSSKKTTKTSSNKKYNISSVKVQDNAILINFSHNISKKHLKFSEYKKSTYFYDDFQLKGNFKDASPTKIKINGINKIRISQEKYNSLKLSIRNKYNTKSIYIFNKRQIIIKLFPKNTTKTNKTKNKIINKTKIKKVIQKVIMIDPGHGGKDSGAVGPRKRYEKIAVLKISKYLYKELKKDGYTVYLTRTHDKYIKLQNRTKLANKKNADIFISIHANSIAKRKASSTTGIETYFLSPARSERSKRIAAKENQSDMQSLGYTSKNLVLNILNRSKITSSQKLAIDVQAYMLHHLRKKYGKVIQDKGVREGPFWVLVGAQMPSILIEVGFISHPSESSRIYSDTYQRLIAKGIAQGINSYFSKN